MSTIIDYAMPMMRIEKLLKDMHNDLLENNFLRAQESALMLVTDARLLHNTISLMKEQHDALRKQTPSV